MSSYVSDLQVPPTLRFILDGEMPSYLLAKDLILQVSFLRRSILFISVCKVISSCTNGMSFLQIYFQIP